MKNILFALLAVFTALPSFAQKNEFGEFREDVLYLNNGVSLRKGSQLEINGPSGEDAKFAYIYHAPENLFDDVNLKLTKRAEPYYAKRVVTVRKVKFAEDKNKQGGRWIVRFRDDTKKDFMCDLIPALNIGEVSVLTGYSAPAPTPMVVPSSSATDANSKDDVKPATKPAGNSTGTLPVGVADELLKLKQLMDDGIITKEEFEAQKKKLLER